MPVSTIHLRHRRPADYGTTPGSTTITRRARELFRRFLNVATSVGALPDSEYFFAYSASDPASACCGLTISGGSGAVGAIINGVTVTATWATSDTNSAALAAAAINASSNALVQGLVTSNNLSATITLASVTAGAEVVVGSTRFIATSGVRPAIVSDGNVCNFDISGSDTADAAALANAINGSPECSRFFFAVAAAAVVRVFARQWTFASNVFSWPTAPRTPPNLLATTSATMTLSATSLTAGTSFGIIATQPGIQGNCMTIALSGTGVTVINSETRFVRGVGCNSVNQIVIDNC